MKNSTYEKILIIIFLLISICPYVHGQGGLATRSTFRNILDMSIIDHGTIRFTYAYNATNLEDYATYDDLQRLEIGEKKSKYYSAFVFSSDSLVTDFRQKNPNVGSAPNRMGEMGKDPKWSEMYYSEHYKDFEKNTLTEYCRATALRGDGNMYYEEEIPTMDWKIQRDTMTVLGYLCQKATCHFRGRDFIAWFASDLPINNGPWKFGGLPGIILKVADTKNLFVFECVEIAQSKTKFPIKMYNEFKAKYKKMDRLKAIKFQQEINTNTVKRAKVVSKPPAKPWVGPTIDPAEIEAHKKAMAARRKYEPLELE